MTQRWSNRRFATGWLCLALCFLFPSLAVGQQLLSLSWDNDLFTGTDQGYTNGVRLTWGRAVQTQPRWLPGREAARRGVGVSVRQIMVTPEDLERRSPDYNDIPYVGYLVADLGWYHWADDRLTGYGMSMGVVGENSGAANTQRWVHKVTGSTNPRGWRHQLGNDTVGGLQLVHARRFKFRSTLAGRQREWSVIGGLRAHSFMSNAELGLFWRTGRNLPGNFVPEYTGMASAIGLPGLLDSRAAGWSLFGGVLAEAIPYSYIEEKAGDYRFDQSPLVGHLMLGAGLHGPRFHGALSLRATSAQEKTHKQPLTFGTLSLAWRL